VSTIRHDGVMKFTDRDGPKRFRVEFSNEDGGSAGVEYVDDIDGETFISLRNAYGCTEYRIETPGMYQERLYHVDVDLRSSLSSMATEDLIEKVGWTQIYKPEWIQALESELKIRDLLENL